MQPPLRGGNAARRTGRLGELFEGEPVALYRRRSGDDTRRLTMDCRVDNAPTKNG